MGLLACLSVCLCVCVCVCVCVCARVSIHFKGTAGCWSPVSPFQLLFVQQVKFLLLTVHHIIADSWSMEIIAHDLIHFIAKEMGRESLHPLMPVSPMVHTEIASDQQVAMR